MTRHDVAVDSPGAVNDDGRVMRRIGLMVFVLCALLARLAAGSDEFEQPPINYSRAAPDNCISRLVAAVEGGDVHLRYDETFGYLPALLEQLDVPVESQMLVFSKTSLQRTRITPRTPRALYFNDEVYVGFCHSGELLEISAADPQLGTAFYSLDQSQGAGPRFTRQTQNCLQCHATTQSDGAPGHTIRSLFVDGEGQPLLAEGSHRVDQTTPIENRWGGWYVTGTHGAQQHLGNFVVHDRDAPRPWSNAAGQNITDASGQFAATRYLSPHSDIVALLVFEHQTYVHNLLTKANYTARQALHYETEINKALGEPADHRLESTTRRIENAGERLVQGLLFVDEAPLKGPVRGTAGFAERFSQHGPRDHQQRSLRDFDLETRLFRYPCSYLIYSREFDALPEFMSQCVARRLRDVLEGRGGEKYSHLSQADRSAITEILRDTKPDLWKCDEK